MESRRGGTPQQQMVVGTVDSPQIAAYKAALRQIEALHPELNPDSAAFRIDLVKQALKLKDQFVAQGLSIDAALIRAVTVMEETSAFTDRHQNKVTRQVEIDAGGHSGFDPKCRWISSQEWSCK